MKGVRRQRESDVASGPDDEASEEDCLWRGDEGKFSKWMVSLSAAAALSTPEFGFKTVIRITVYDGL